MEDVDVLVIGAGLAGLSCARALAGAGKRVLVLERSSRVGGRCAAKPAGSRPLDFGPVFVHGDDPEFLSWASSLGDGLMEGWPRVVEGRGTPCQPQAFDPLQRRFAVQGGIRRLAEYLARGLEVLCGVQVESLVWTPEGVEALAQDGRRFRGRDAVAALALEQTLALTAPVPGVPEEPAWTGARALLSQFSSLPCLTVLAEYSPSEPLPPWDVLYPEGGSTILLVSHETSKQPTEPGAGPALVIQARPGWSASRLHGDRETWTRELLDETGRLVGAWAAQPRSLVTHRWQFARLGAADHLVRPLVLHRDGSPGRLGLAGDLFDPDGGLQGAWRSGRRLALRLV